MTFLPVPRVRPQDPAPGPALVAPAPAPAAPRPTAGARPALLHRLGRRLCVIRPGDYSMSDAVAFMTGAKLPDGVEVEV